MCASIDDVYAEKSDPVVLNAEGSVQSDNVDESPSLLRTPVAAEAENEAATV